MQMQSIHEYDTESNLYNVDGNTPRRRDPVDPDLASFKPGDDAVRSRGNNRNSKIDDTDDCIDDKNTDKEESEKANEKIAKPDDDIVKKSLGIENESFGSADDNMLSEEDAEMKNNQFTKQLIRRKTAC